MYNQNLLRSIKGLVALVLAGFLFASGFLSAHVTHHKKETPQAKTSTEKTSTSSEAEGTAILTEKQVEEFLLAYYTKKDLGENRSRYKPYVTDGLYTELTNEESDPVNEAYRGYVVDQVFEGATIYIDTTNQKAIAQVSYSNYLLEEKENREGNSTKQTGKLTVRLSYVEVDGKLMIDRMEPVVLSDGSDIKASGYTTQ